MTLRTRIALAFVSALLLMQLLGFGVVLSSIRENVATSVKEEVAMGGLVLDRLISQNHEALSRVANNVSHDSSFIWAVAGKDNALIRSLLQKHRRRADLDLMGFVSRDGTFQQMFDRLGHTHPVSAAMSEEVADFPIAPVTGNMMVVDHKLLQFALVPVNARTDPGFASLGQLFVATRVDETLTEDLKKLTAIDLALLAVDRRVKGTGEVQVFSGSSRLTESEIANSLSLGRKAYGKPFETAHRGVSYSGLLRTLRGVDGFEVMVLLERSISEVAAQYNRLHVALIILAVVGVIYSFLVSFLTAHRISRPIRRLAHDAKRLGEGHRDVDFKSDSNDEIGQLAQAFKAMSSKMLDRESMIRSIAYRDELTGLPNRNSLLLSLAEVVPGRKSGALFILNLRRFKFVNDVLGLAAGDRLLKLVGERLSGRLESGQFVLARIGGNEFAVMCPDFDAERVTGLATELLCALESPFEVAETMIDVRATGGIACWPEDASSAPMLLARAEAAMFESRQGSNAIARYDESKDLSSEASLSMISALRRAIGQRELKLYYQPQIDLGTKKSNAVEALVRWFHPSRGMVPPDSFIPFAESTGLIAEITSYVLREAVAQVARWNSGGLNLSVSVNLSARDLMNTQLSVQIQGLLDEFKVRADQIVLEITESAIIEDFENACRTLNLLRSLGLRISVDDYGTGYSSLAYLKDLPVDELKIDRSFLLRIANDPNDQVIVRSTIDLGHNLGLTVVAEGIEDEGTANLLVRLGCDSAQGYFFGKPMEAATVAPWVRSWNARPDVPADSALAGRSEMPGSVS